MKLYALLLVSTAPLWFAQSAAAQNAATATAAQPAPQQPTTGSQSQPAPQQAQPAPDITDDYGDETDTSPIVVTGSKPRGSVVGDIPPEQTLDSRDIQATGATSIDELLTALGPQIGSTQGRGGERPVLLLNGQRISGYQELRDIPTEAIERVDILPEEVALKYGYTADQKVVNIVLRRFFRSTTVTATGQVATEGDYASGTGDVTRLMIGRNGRTSLNLHVQGNGMLTEAERNIALQQPPNSTDVTDQQQQQELNARSLIGSKRDVRAAAVVNRTVLGDVAATVNTEVEHINGKSLFGLSDFDASVLNRNTATDTAHVAAILNWGTNWRWSSTSNADYSQNITNSDSRTSRLNDRASSIQESAGSDLTAHGNLFALPGGQVGTTARVAASTLHMTSSRVGPDLTNANHSLNRTAGTASITLDAPLSHRGSDFSTLGNLTLNGNAQVQQLSDFGTLTKLGAGLNWSPVERLELISSWNREQGAPTVEQLGDPLLSTPSTRLFDFVTGQSVLATVITGGNPNLLADKRTVLKFSGNWQPFSKIDLRLRAEYTDQHIDRPISDLPSPTPAIEAAFPDRFVRCPAGATSCTPGQLISADLRPVNFDSSQRNQLTLGFDFTHSLKSAPPSAATIAAYRQRMAAAGMPVPQQGSSSPPGSQSGASAQGRPANGGGGRGGGGGYRGGGGRGGGFFGGRNGGRVMFSLTDTITFVDKVQIRPGLNLDYLHGDAIGQNGGQPRHDVQARANYFNNGLGAMLTANWRSGTEVNTATGDNLHFSPYSTFDLRLFDNLGQQPDTVLKHPWLRGASVRFEISNIFDAKPQVHSSTGQPLLNYQPNLLEPLGRTISITFRKLFLPSPSWFRQQFQRDRQQQQTGSTRS
ncbi:MAG TPA: TonB-dependent receptor [Sphingomicrobium sp.]|nr:TonB-dependent receptor [Sphingomicrobium sp.]